MIAMASGERHQQSPKQTLVAVVVLLLGLLLCTWCWCAAIVRMLDLWLNLRVWFVHNFLVKRSSSSSSSGPNSIF